MPPTDTPTSPPGEPEHGADTLFGSTYRELRRLAHARLRGGVPQHAAGHDRPRPRVVRADAEGGRRPDFRIGRDFSVMQGR